MLVSSHHIRRAVAAESLAGTLGFLTVQTVLSDGLPPALPVPFAQVSGLRLAEGLVLVAASALVMKLLSGKQAALWAAELPALRLCDNGVDDRQEVRHASFNVTDLALLGL